MGAWPPVRLFLFQKVGAGESQICTDDQGSRTFEGLNPWFIGVPRTEFRHMVTLPSFPLLATTPAYRGWQERLIDREIGTCIANVNVTLDAVSEHVRKDIGPVKSERRRSKVRYISHGSKWQGTLTGRRRMSDKSCFLTGFNESSKITPSGPRQGTPENSFRCPIMGMKMMITDP